MSASIVSEVEDRFSMFAQGYQRKTMADEQVLLRRWKDIKEEKSSFVTFIIANFVTPLTSDLKVCA